MFLCSELEGVKGSWGEIPGKYIKDLEKLGLQTWTNNEPGLHRVSSMSFQETTLQGSLCAVSQCH